MCSLDSIYSDCLVASIAGFITRIVLDGPSLEGIDHIVHCHVHGIIGSSNRNFLYGLCWYQDLLARDCWEIYQYCYWSEWDISWNRMRWDSLRCTCSMRVQKSEGING